MNSKILEICAFSLDASIQAEKAGASKIALCAAPGEGGTTPSFGLMKKVCKSVSIPVIAFIRPRGGDFIYSKKEFNVMKEDIKMAKKAGCSGVTLGILTKDCTIDIERTTQLVELAQPMSVTFGRAIDLTPNPTQAILDIIKTGCQRILTSGGRIKVENNIPLLNDLIKIADNKIVVMPGFSTNDHNLQLLVEHINTNEFHASARISFTEDHLSSLGFGVSVSYDQASIKMMKSILDNHKVEKQPFL